MGLLILALLLLCELGFLLWTEKKEPLRRAWLRNRAIVSIGELLLFLLLTGLFAPAQRSLRFGGCLLVLLLRAVIAGIVYFRKRGRIGAEEPQPRGRTVCSLIRALLLAGLALVPAFLFTGYAGLGTGGGYEAAQAAAILVDGSRTDPFESDGSCREVPVHFYYPAGAEGGEDAFPLVVFSHGAFGYYQSNTSLYLDMASRGYVVVSLDHPHHAFFTKDTDGRLIPVDMEFMASAMSTEADELSQEEQFALTRDWMALRTADMDLVLDALEAAGETGEFPAGAWYFQDAGQEAGVKAAVAMADTGRIGLMGHSMGGASAVAAGRSRSDIAAVADIDGTMLSEQLALENGVYTYSEEPYPVPLLSIDNENHYRMGEELGTAYVNNAVLENALDGHHTWFAGSAHMNFTDLPLLSPALTALLGESGTGTIDPEACIRQLNAVVLQFFDYYLKGEGELDTLQPQYF